MLNKYLLLDWIEDFHCVGAECPKTCCGTWNIALKETEIEKYRALAETHPFGRKICEAVDEERKCMRQKDRRCLLLTEEGWCRIVLECGEEYLSDTCTVFPRMMREFGDTLECLVEIACPVVAGRVLEDRSIGFGYEEIEAAAGEEAPPCDYALYDTLSLARTFLIELFQEYDASYSGAKIKLYPLSRTFFQSALGNVCSLLLSLTIPFRGYIPVVIYP